MRLSQAISVLHKAIRLHADLRARGVLLAWMHQSLPILDFSQQARNRITPTLRTRATPVTSAWLALKSGARLARSLKSVLLNANRARLGDSRLKEVRRPCFHAVDEHSQTRPRALTARLDRSALKAHRNHCRKLM